MTWVGRSETKEVKVAASLTLLYLSVPPAPPRARQADPGKGCEECPVTPAAKAEDGTLPGSPTIQKTGQKKEAQPKLFVMLSYKKQPQRGPTIRTQALEGSPKGGQEPNKQEIQAGRTRDFKRRN